MSLSLLHKTEKQKKISTMVIYFKISILPSYDYSAVTWLRVRCEFSSKCILALTDVIVVYFGLSQNLVYLLLAFVQKSACICTIVNIMFIFFQNINLQ